MSQPSRSLHRVLPLAGALCLSAFASASSAQPKGNAGAAGAEDAAAAGAFGSGPELDRVADPRVSLIASLSLGQLDPAVDPQSLFETSLVDEVALELDRVRLRALLERLDAPATKPAASGSAKAKPPASAAPSASAAASAPSLQADIDALDKPAWQARVALDRARLAFLSLPVARRAEILADHAARREAAKPKESPEDRRARLAAEEQARVLAAASQARSEAERLVGEELARLIGVERDVNAARESFREARPLLAARKDAVLGVQRRVRDAKAADAASADAAYDAVRASLRSARDALERSLDDLATGRSAIPPLGDDPLVDIPAEVSTDAVRQRRAAVADNIRVASSEEVLLRHARTAAMLDEVNVLNRERLGLLPALSAEKRSAVTSFSPTGLEQAAAEARHLKLVLRYHQQVALGWAKTIRSGGSSNVSLWTVGVTLVPWLLLLAGFAWLRRRIGPLLALVASRFEEEDRSDRRTTPSVPTHAARFASRVHRPLEWLAFGALSLWLLPPSVRSLLEVQLVALAIAWVFSGALVVNVIDAIAATTDHPLSEEAAPAAALRLRSLRLVGRIVTLFALVLVVTARLVGEGTVYTWVLSTCWIAAVPVFLLIVRWWRETIFERVEAVRKKTAVQSWVLANRAGWKSFLAGIVGAVHLFATGTVKVVRDRVSSFNLARRAHAYLFRRELDRLAEDGQDVAKLPLPPAAASALSPERSDGERLPSPGDVVSAALALRLGAGKGGVFGLVAPRGLGKSSLLRALAAEHEGATLVACTTETSLETLRAIVDALPPSPDAAPRLVLLDDAHVLVRPVIGGFAELDAVLSLARATDDRLVWVFSIDALLWPLIARARDARPLFDHLHVLEPWNEEQIGALVDARTQEAGLSPSFDDLLEPLPPSADEIDRLEALESRKRGYVRMLWDHVRGNPGLALQAWRASLALTPSGELRVRALPQPDVTQLETLPDTTLFVLRAVMQLSPAQPATVATITRLSSEQVTNTLRFGEANGYLEATDEGFRVSWRWLDTLQRLLERRHLLVRA